MEEKKNKKLGVMTFTSDAVRDKQMEELRNKLKKANRLSWVLSIVFLVVGVGIGLVLNKYIY